MREERSVGDLVTELARETQTLIRQEFQLARTEAVKKASKAGKDVAVMATGGSVAYAGFIVLVIGLAILLGTIMPIWLAFTIAGLIVISAGYAVLKSGLNSLKNTDFSFDRTTATLKEDKLWMSQEAQEVKNDPKNLGAER